MKASAQMSAQISQLVRPRTCTSFSIRPRKLPFDNHWYLAPCAPRAVIALEGDMDQNVNKYGMRQSFLAAQPAFEFLGVKDRVGVNWANRPHGEVQGDWDALFAFADKHLAEKGRHPPVRRLSPGRADAATTGAGGRGISGSEFAARSSRFSVLVRPLQSRRETANHAKACTTNTFCLCLLRRLRCLCR